MDGPRNYHVKSDREGDKLYGISHMWTLKKKSYNELTYKTNLGNELLVVMGVGTVEGMDS